MFIRVIGQRLAGTIAMLVIILTIATLLYVFSLPSYRYEKYKCQHDLIYNQTGVVDVAIIGSSSTQLGVGPEHISKAFSNEFGKQAVVYDLSKGWRGQGIKYTIIRDLVENRKVKHLLIEANLAESGKYHAHWYLVGRYNDFLKSIWYQQEEGINIPAIFEVIKMPIDRIVDRITSIILDELSLPTVIDDKRSAITSGCYAHEEPIDVKRLEERYASYKKYYEGKTWSWNMNASHQLHDTGFFRELVKLANDNGATIHFYYVHERHYSRLEPKFTAVFEKNTGAKLFIPPESLVDSLEVDGYADPTHMRPRGRKLYSEWLASVLISSLSAKD